MSDRGPSQLPEQVPKPVPKQVRSLTVLHTPDPTLRGRVLAIGKGLSIGRSSESGVDLAINDRLLSRRHASISPVGTSTSCELIDHDSRNGSFVDGMRVTRTAVGSGSIIRLGVTLFELTGEDEDVEQTLDDDFDEREPFLGRSTAFRRALDSIAAAARSSEPVTIFGEPGSGKKRTAKRIHVASGRTGRFVVVHCGNAASRISDSQLFGGADEDMESTSADGFLPMASGGTLLLHEIDLLAPPLQDKLLAFLETGKYEEAGTGRTARSDARIIASSGASLDAAVDAGAFSPKLRDKLAAVTVEMPPLKQRRSDIPLLAQHFLKLEAPSRRFDWSATCLEKLLLYDWPSNVRELHNVMRRLTMVEEDVTVLRSAHLPKEIRKRLRMPSEDALKASAITIHTAPSREELAALLAAHKGNVARVAEHYAKDRRHVYRWLLRHDLSASDFRD